MTPAAISGLLRLGPVGALIGLATLGSAWLTPSAAQTPAAASGEDLTLPPDWRRGAAPRAPASTVAQPSRRGHEPGARPRAAADRNDGGTTASAPSKPVSEHPVDLGVMLRGGSGTPRVYGQTGTAQPLQETGSAFGAGMRVGF